MLSPNVEIVRRIYASGAWDGGGGSAGALGLIDPEFEFVNPADAVGPGTRHGHVVELAGSLGPPVVPPADRARDGLAHDVLSPVACG